MTYYETFKERKETVEAFRVDFEEEDSIFDILDAFDADYDTWTLDSRGNNWSLSFPRPKKKAEAAQLEVLPSGHYAYTTTITIAPGHDVNRITVNESDWIVKKWIDTDHPEVVVMKDKDFQRKYREE